MTSTTPRLDALTLPQRAALISALNAALISELGGLHQADGRQQAGLDTTGYHVEGLVLPAAIAEAALAALGSRRRLPMFSESHLRVAYLLADAMGATDTQLERRWAARAARTAAPWPLISPAGIRSRRAELVAWGLVEWSGVTGRTLANRPTKSWQWISADNEANPGRVPIPPLSPDALAALPLLEAEAGTNVVLGGFLADVRRYTSTQA